MHATWVIGQKKLQRNTSPLSGSCRGLMAGACRALSLMRYRSRRHYLCELGWIDRRRADAIEHNLEVLGGESREQHMGWRGGRGEKR